jgi:germination protein M
MAWDFKRMEEKENERRRGHLHFVLMVVLTVAFLVVGGCSLTERMGTSSKEARTPELEDDILGLEGEDAVFSEEAEGTKVTLYFKNQEENCLVPVTQDVPKVTGIAKATLEAEDSMTITYPKRATNLQVGWQEQQQKHRRLLTSQPVSPGACAESRH